MTAVGRADTVKLKTGITVTGEVVRYDERGVAVQIPDNKQIREYAAADVLSVEVRQSEAQRLAEAALAGNDFGQAVQRFEEALKDEQRDWARARIRAGLSRALWNAGRFVEAGEQFLTIVERRDDAEVMALAPLVWTPSTVLSDSARTTARRWLSDPGRPIAKLLAASWLLETQDQENAGRALDRLQTDSDRRVSWIARAQLWRKRAKSATSDDIRRYRALLEQMPEAIRGGPQFLLGLALEQSGRPVEAALAYLWVAWVYDSGGPLAGEALWRAARATDQAGFHKDARALYEEVAQKFPATPWASAARHRVGEMGPPSSPESKEPTGAPVKSIPPTTRKE